MELPVDDRPLMAKFTATLPTRVVSDCGSMCAIFEAGETLSINRKLFTAAIAAGLVPEEPLIVQTPPVVVQKSQEEVVVDGLLEACKLLIAKGDPGDFTMTGFPRAASVKKLVDFHFTTKDIERAFGEAMHEVERDGNDSTEHSEPVSSAAE